MSFSAQTPTASSTDPLSDPSIDPPDAVRLLRPDGERQNHPDYDVDLTDAEYLGLFRDLVRTRAFDNQATALQRQGQLALWAQSLGQEAAQVGSARALQPRDMAFPSYREHGVALCRGVDPVDLLKMFRGVSHGGWDPAEHNLHMYTIVIGAQTLHATGYAMGIARTGDDEAVIAYFGDGASSQGDVSEAFNWASVYHAPVVFFCQNNQWAISEATERQSKIPLYRRADGFGFPGVRVDGNDVLACYAVTRAALEDARSGQGPRLIEAYTYRMGAHTTSDDPSRYRPASQDELWRARDPLDRMRLFLTRQRIADSDELAAVDADAAELAARVRTGVSNIPNPAPEQMFDHVYTEDHPLIEAQRHEFAAYHDGFVDAAEEGAGR